MCDNTYEPPDEEADAVDEDAYVESDCEPEPYTDGYETET
jgi:hypothetical protein